MRRADSHREPRLGRAVEPAPEQAVGRDHGRAHHDGAGDQHGELAVVGRDQM